MRFFAALLLVCALAPSARSQSFRKEHVAADAAWTLHCDVAALFKSRLGQRLAQTMEKHDAAHQLAAFRAMFQLDPTKDIAAVTLYGRAENPQDGVALVHGRFKPDHIATILKANPTYREHRHGKASIHEWQNEKKDAAGEEQKSEPMFLSFRGDGLLALSSSLTAAQHALDVLARSKPSLTNPDLLRGMEQAAPGNYLRLNASMAGIKEALPQQNEMLDNVKTLRVAIGESLDNLNLHLMLDIADAETAAQMHAMAQGFLAMAQMQNADNPDLARLIQRLSITLDGSSLRAAFKIPVQEALDATDKLPIQVAPGGGGFGVGVE